jgi:transketolase
VRDVFVEALIEEMRVRNDIFLLTADLGFGVLHKVEDEFPNRFLNVGIAEQNMASVAAGMAMEGLTVVCYSIGNFPTLRCLEQLRNDIGYHKANVKVVTVGGGFSYGPLGMSHHATEDLSILRALPNFDVIVPSSMWEVAQCVRVMFEVDGPAYLRLDKSNMPDDSAATSELVRGEIRCVRSGTDVALVGCGGVMGNAIDAAVKLEREGISVAVFTVPFVEPLDFASFVSNGLTQAVVVTIEENALAGGLGSKILELFADAGRQTSGLRRIGLKRAYESTVGSQEFLRERHGLDTESILATLRRAVGQ